VRASVLVETAAMRRAEQRFFSRFYGAAAQVSTSLKTADAKLRPVLDWMGRPQSERLSGVATQVWEASTRLRVEQRFKANSFRLGGSFERYVSGAAEGATVDAHSEAVVLPTSWDGALKSVGMRDKGGADEAGTLVKAKLWLAPDFALNGRHFLMLLDVIAVASRRARKVQRAVGGWAMREAFPMKLHVPLLLTVWAQVSCTAYKPLDGASLPDGWLSVPDEYERKTADPESVLLPEGAGQSNRHYD